LWEENLRHLSELLESLESEPFDRFAQPEWLSVPEALVGLCREPAKDNSPGL